MSAETKLLKLILSDLDERISETTRYQEYIDWNEFMPGFWKYEIPQKKLHSVLEGIQPGENDPDYLPRINNAEVRRWGTSNVLLAFAYAPEIDTVIFKYIAPSAHRF